MLFVNNHSTRIKPCAMIIILLQIYNFIFKNARILFKNLLFHFREKRVLELLVKGYGIKSLRISKQLLVKSKVHLKRTETFDNALTAKCFIYDVTSCSSLFSSLFTIVYNPNIVVQLLF